MTEAIVTGGGLGLAVALLLGFRRLAWRYAGLIGLGVAIVFTLLRWVPPEVSPGTAMLLAALGGGAVALGVERGERDHARRATRTPARDEAAGGGGPEPG